MDEKRRYRQAFWDEPLLSEIGRKGRLGFIVPEDPKVKDWARSKGDLMPKSQRRAGDAPLPELSELQVLRHFNRLSQMNFSVETGMYLVVPWVVPLVSARKGIRPGQVRFSKTG